jgi:Uma2 family endonuclease
MTSPPTETASVPSSITDEATQADPYRYGWRYVRRRLEDGNEVLEQVPLTLEDVLHPEEGDFIVQSDLHHQLCTYFYDALRARVAHDPSAVVLSDVRVAWDVPGLRPYGPDIAVIFGVRERRNWSTFDVAQEGVRPALIIEVTSPETRQFDLVDKFDGYDLAGIPLYIIVDITSRRGRSIPRLIGYRQTLTVYEALVPDERGWLWLEAVGLWLGVQEGQVVCFDQAGNPIGDYPRIEAARAEAEDRAEAAEARAEASDTARIAAESRADAAEARLRALEAELRQLRDE